MDTQGAWDAKMSKDGGSETRRNQGWQCSLELGVRFSSPGKNRSDKVVAVLGDRALLLDRLRFPKDVYEVRLLMPHVQLHLGSRRSGGLA